MRILHIHSDLQECKNSIIYITFQFDNKNFMDNYKFDIKKAKDISARLDDVKGIDEIKEELENLIKMLKEPDRYH